MPDTPAFSRLDLVEHRVSDLRDQMRELSAKAVTKDTLQLHLRNVSTTLDALQEDVREVKKEDQQRRMLVLGSLLTAAASVVISVLMGGVSL